MRSVPPRCAACGGHRGRPDRAGRDGDRRRAVPVSTARSRAGRPGSRRATCTRLAARHPDRAVAGRPPPSARRRRGTSRVTALRRRVDPGDRPVVAVDDPDRALADRDGARAVADVDRRRRPCPSADRPRDRPGLLARDPERAAPAAIAVGFGPTGIESRDAGGGRDRSRSTRPSTPGGDPQRAAGERDARSARCPRRSRAAPCWRRDRPARRCARRRRRPRATRRRTPAPWALRRPGWSRPRSRLRWMRETVPSSEFATQIEPAAADHGRRAAADRPLLRDRSAVGIDDPDGVLVDARQAVRARHAADAEGGRAREQQEPRLRPARPRRAARRRPRAAAGRAAGSVARSSAGSWARIASCRRRSSAPGSTPISLDQDRARVAVGLERLGLAARAVQREHPLRVQPLAQRVLGDERVELADHLAVPAGRRGRSSIADSAACSRSSLEPPDLRRRRTARRPRRRADRRATGRAPHEAAPASSERREAGDVDLAVGSRSS